MSTLQAIPTRYKGYHFRSRLEARWAVCLDALGLSWEYEPEGFSLPSGPYLPDFLVRTSAETTYVEIKPWGMTQPDAAVALGKCVELQSLTGVDVWMFVGSPGDNLSGYMQTTRDDIRQFRGAEGFRQTMHALLDPHRTRPIDFFETMNASAAARSARFEHGQSGPT